jgi:hypothetical protein
VVCWAACYRRCFQDPEDRYGIQPRYSEVERREVNVVAEATSLGYWLDTHWVHILVHFNLGVAFAAFVREGVALVNTVSIQA